MFTYSSDNLGLKYLFILVQYIGILYTRFKTTLQTRDLLSLLFDNKGSDFNKSKF